MAWLEGIRGALIDVDGTLLNGDAAFPGAPEALERFRKAAIPFRLVTNTTRRSRRAVAEALRRAGFAIDEEEVLLPARLARRRILESGCTRALLLVPGEAQADFEGVLNASGAVDWVVVGDLGRDFGYDVLNEAFRSLRAGASLLALHKNPFWHAGERGIVLDAGAFVAGLEYAAGVTAEVVGKPALPFFQLCLRDLGVDAARVAVIGDDPVNDAEGGSAAGCKTILVRTGKLGARTTAAGEPRADLIVTSFSDLAP